MKTREQLQEMWDKGTRGYFDIWNIAYPCPVCKETSVNFAGVISSC